MGANVMRAVIGRRAYLGLTAAMVAGVGASALGTRAEAKAAPGLWRVWDEHFARAKFVCLSHLLTPDSPLWSGFLNNAHFGLAKVKPDGSDHYIDASYDNVGWTSYSYTIPNESWGTHFDSPAHFSPCQTSADEIPPTYALRKLVVISMVEQVAADKGHQLSVNDILAWEKRHGRVPEGSVVMVRSDWSKLWDSDPKAFLADDNVFPGVSLEAVKFLHHERKILYHGHETLDTDNTPTLLAEDWLTAHGYPQAEAVANLDQVPETGALITFGVPKIKGAIGGMLLIHAICPADWKYGVAPGDVAESPLPYHDKKYVYDDKKGIRERSAACDVPHGAMQHNKE